MSLLVLDTGPGFLLRWDLWLAGIRLMVYGESDLLETDLRVTLGGETHAYLT